MGERVEGIDENGVHIGNIRGGQKKVIEANIIVSALGVDPVQHLSEELRSKSVQCYEMEIARNHGMS